MMGRLVIHVSFIFVGIYHSLSFFKIVYCLKSVSIWSYSGPYFPAFGLKNSEYGHFFCSGCSDIFRQTSREMSRKDAALQTIVLHLGFFLNNLLNFSGEQL